MGQGGKVLVAAALVMAACGNSGSDPAPLTDPTTTPTVSTTATTGAPTTSLATTSTTATPTTTATTEAPVETVGTVEAFEAQIDAVYDRLGSFATPRDEVPFPDATNVDPLVALEDLIEFHFWVMSTNPWRDWVELYALDGTEYASDRRIQADRYSRVEAQLFIEDENPFRFLEASIVDLSVVGAPAAVTDSLPETAVALEYLSSIGDFYAAVISDGRVFEEYDGWSELVSQAIVVQTEAGWRIAFVRWND